MLVRGGPKHLGGRCAETGKSCSSVALGEGGGGGDWRVGRKRVKLPHAPASEQSLRNSSKTPTWSNVRVNAMWRPTDRGYVSPRLGHRSGDAWPT